MFKILVPAFVAIITLSGCVATVDGLVKSADDAMTKFTDSAKSKAGTPAVTAKSVKADEYVAFAGAEISLVRRLTANQKASGLIWWLAERKISVRSIGTQKVQSVQLASSFRTELPGDAIAARHRSVLSAIDSMTEYVSMRRSQEPSRLVIAGRNQADVDWMKEAAAETLTRIGSTNLTINTEISAKPSIGWMSEGASDRTI